MGISRHGRSGNSPCFDVERPRWGACALHNQLLAESLERSLAGLLPPGLSLAGRLPASAGAMGERLPTEAAVASPAPRGRRPWRNWELTVPLEVLQLDLDALAVLFGGVVYDLQKVLVVVDGLPRGRAGRHTKSTDWVIIDVTTPEYCEGKRLLRDQQMNVVWNDGKSV